MVLWMMEGVGRGMWVTLREGVGEAVSEGGGHYQDLSK